jgi:hypothetical protein
MVIAGPPPPLSDWFASSTTFHWPTSPSGLPAVRPCAPTLHTTINDGVLTEEDEQK